MQAIVDNYVVHGFSLQTLEDIVLFQVAMGRAEEVLRGLSTLREEDVLCDVQLDVEGRQISAHKVVLAAASPYFKAMFSGNFKETTLGVVHMKEVSFIGLTNVIECIYTTTIDTNMEKIEDIFPAAHLLQMNDIVDECIELMGKNISKSNCFKFLEMAEKFNIEGLQESINEFILKNFVAASKTKDFDEISKEALIRYLSSDTLKTNINEYAVFQAARKWIVANNIPTKEIPEIMSHIRFGLIPPGILNDILSDNLIDDNKECRRMILDSLLYHTNLFSQPLYHGTLNKPRGEAGVLLIPGCYKADEGHNVTDDYVDVEFISFPEINFNDNYSQLDLPIVFDSMCSIQMNNFLFVFGVNGNGYQNFTKRYDASTDRWLELAPVPRQAIVGAATANSGKYIFLLGGMKVDKDTDYEIISDEITDSVYMYDISENTWSESISVPTKLMHGAATNLQ